MYYNISFYATDDLNQTVSYYILPINHSLKLPSLVKCVVLVSRKHIETLLDNTIRLPNALDNIAHYAYTDSTARYADIESLVTFYIPQFCVNLRRLLAV